MTAKLPKAQENVSDRVVTCFRVAFDWRVVRGFFDKSQDEIRQTKTIRDYFLHSVENLFYHQMSVHGNPGLHWHKFTSLCDWSIKLLQTKPSFKQINATRLSPSFHGFNFSS